MLSELIANLPGCWAPLEEGQARWEPAWDTHARDCSHTPQGGHQPSSHTAEAAALVTG